MRAWGRNKYAGSLTLYVLEIKVFLLAPADLPESRYEAEHSNIPVTLVDIDSLAELVVDYYESFDTE